MERPQKEINGKVALAVPESDKEFLILKRSEQNSSSGKWVFPGGKIEEGETAREAALRELEEETGLKGEIVSTGQDYIGEGELGYWEMHPFHVEVEKKEVNLDYEHSDYMWLKLKELEDLDTMGQLKSLRSLKII